MGLFDDMKMAELSQEDIETIQRLERKLGPDVRLVAVEAKDVLFVLEAKMAPNVWERVDSVYPQIDGIKAFYTDRDLAREAKGWLKGFLISNNLSPKPRKRPIRVRQVVNTEG